MEWQIQLVLVHLLSIIFCKGNDFLVIKYVCRRNPKVLYVIFIYSNESVENKKGSQNVSESLSGERGIRTPGASQHGSFQDYCNRPLYHLSKDEACCLSFASAKVISFLLSPKYFRINMPIYDKKVVKVGGGDGKNEIKYLY